MTAGWIGMRAAAFGAVLALVVGCSGLVPPVPVEDLFGLDGAVLELADLTPAALAGPVTSFGASVTVTVESEGFNLPAVVTASKLVEKVVFSGTVQVVAPGDVAGELPATFALTGGSVAVTVKDGGTTIGSAAGSAAFNPALTFTKGGCTFALAETTCTYTGSVNVAAHGIVVTATASSARAVFNALRDGKTLTVDATVGATLAAPGLSADARIRVTISTQDGEISF